MLDRRRFLVATAILVLALAAITIIGSGHTGDVIGNAEDDADGGKPSAIGFEYDPADDRYESSVPNGTELCIGNC